MEHADVQVSSPTERKDDWQAEARAASDQNIGGVPTFIRVIVIRRILGNDRKHNTNNNDKNEKYIKSLVTCMADLNDSIQSKVYKTLSQLIRKNGIGSYFNSWDEKDNNPSIIETIFNKLILTKFANEYQEIMTYKSKNKNMQNNKYYQALVFNIQDLMCSIFEFLDFDYDLENCSLVCSHWLYHVYNTSIFNIDIFWFEELISATIRYDVKNNDSSGARLWQRLTKLKSIDLDLNGIDGNVSPNQLQLLLDKLSNLKNVEKIDGSCSTSPGDLAIIQCIIKNNKENVKHYKVDICSGAKLILSPLALPNVEYVLIKGLCFYIIWSHKCQELVLQTPLYHGYICDKEWCNFVINNCDCSNIKSLTFLGKIFVKNDFFNINIEQNEEKEEKADGKKLLKKLAQQFINLQKLEIKSFRYCDDVLLLFCQYLTQIINKNDVKMQLVFDLDFEEFNKAIKWMKQVNIANKINKIDFSLSKRSRDETLESIKALLTLCNSNVEWITFTNQKSTNTCVDSIVDFMNQTIFKSLNLKVFEYHGFKYGDYPRSTIETVNKVLEMVIDKLKKRKFYFIGRFKIDYEKKMDSLFDIFCQKIIDLIMTNQIPIDISLTIINLPTSKYDEYRNNINLLVNEQRIFKDYKEPQCNKYCVPVLTPTMSIKRNYDWKSIKFVAKSAQKLRF